MMTPAAGSRAIPSESWGVGGLRVAALREDRNQPDRHNPDRRNNGQKRAEAGREARGHLGEAFQELHHNGDDQEQVAVVEEEQQLEHGTPPRLGPAAQPAEDEGVDGVATKAPPQQEPTQSAHGARLPLPHLLCQLLKGLVDHLAAPIVLPELQGKRDRRRIHEGKRLLLGLDLHQLLRLAHARHARQLSVEPSAVGASIDTVHRHHDALIELRADLVWANVGVEDLGNRQEHLVVVCQTLAERPRLLLETFHRCGHLKSRSSSARWNPSRTHQQP
mmetsp:Transcript_54996/g.170752  ORF Transcript_54996/g.170752 Transcript_54996/m.170752 type:complete len:276 (+) Transcript_54996:153-980(+)